MVPEVINRIREYRTGTLTDSVREEVWSVVNETWEALGVRRTVGHSSFWTEEGPRGRRSPGGASTRPGQIRHLCSDKVGVLGSRFSRSYSITDFGTPYFSKKEILLEVTSVR